MTPDPIAAAELTARYHEWQAAAWRLLAAYRAADAIPPKPLRRITEAADTPRRRRPAPTRPATDQPDPAPPKRKGPEPKVLRRVAGWFAGRDNLPATYAEIAEATGLTMRQVRNCCSRNELGAFERVGTVTVNDLPRAQVRLTEAGRQIAAS